MKDINGKIAILDASPTEARGFSSRVAELLGIKDHDGNVEKFRDGETKIVIKKHIRGMDAYIFQSYIPPIGERVYELTNMMDASGPWGKARRITAVIPYCFGQRGERPTGARQSVPAAVVAKTLAATGAEKVLTCGLHTDVIQTIFEMVHIKPDHLEFEPLVANYVLNLEKSQGYSHLVFGSPDVGGAKRVRNLRKTAMSKRPSESTLQTRIAIADKYRYDDDQVTVEELVGDVENKPVVLYDDIGDTFGTMSGAVELYAEHGAGPIYVVVIHPVLGEGYEKNLEAIVRNPAVAEVVMGNTLPLKPFARSLEKVRIIPLEPFVAEAIRRLNGDESLSELHEYDKIMSIYHRYNENSRIEKDQKEIKIG